MQDERLIECVRNREFLYNLKHAKYMDAKYKNVAWREIAEELNQPAALCKKRWANIRDQFRKHRAKTGTVRSGQAADAPVRKYKYEDVLQFLCPYFQERNMLSSIQSTSGLSFVDVENPAASPPESSHEGTQSLTEPDGEEQLQPPKRRKVAELRKMQEELREQVKNCLEEIKVMTTASRPAASATAAAATDTAADAEKAEHEIFFKSIATTVYSFEKKKQLEVRERFFKIVHEIQMGREHS